MTSTEARSLTLLAALLVAGCAGAPARDGTVACGEVYDPLFDPAGPRTEVEHEVISMPPGAVEPGCVELREGDAFRATWARGTADAGEPPAVDFASSRVAALRAPERHTDDCWSFSVRDVYRLPESTVVATRLARSTGGSDCNAQVAVWGVVLPKDGTRVLHAHDQRT